MKADNKKRDLLSQEGARYHDLEQMSQKQVQDLDWKHPDFRWRA